MRCEVWPSSGGRHFVHVPMGSSQQKWHTSLQMLKSFEKKREIGFYQIQGRTQSNSGLLPMEAPAVRTPIVPGRSYADIVRRRGDHSSSVLDWEKQSSKSPVSRFEKQNKAALWIQKDHEVIQEDFNNLWIISRMFVFNEWKEIKKAVENFLQQKVIINPLFVDNALIKINQGKLEDLIVTSPAPFTCNLKK